MSSITLILISRNIIQFRQLHYRHAITVLESACAGIESIITDDRPDRFIDAGYILIDLDRKRIVSGQDAFSIHHLGKNAKRILKERFDLVVGPCT